MSEPHLWDTGWARFRAALEDLDRELRDQAADVSASVSQALDLPGIEDLRRRIEQDQADIEAAVKRILGE